MSTSLAVRKGSVLAAVGRVDGVGRALGGRRRPGASTKAAATSARRPGGRGERGTRAGETTVHDTSFRRRVGRPLVHGLSVQRRSRCVAAQGAQLRGRARRCRGRRQSCPGRRRRPTRPDRSHCATSAGLERAQFVGRADEQPVQRRDPAAHVVGREHLHERAAQHDADVVAGTERDSIRSENQNTRRHAEEHRHQAETRRRRGAAFGPAS